MSVSEYEQIGDLVGAFRFERPSLHAYFIVNCYFYDAGSDSHFRCVFYEIYIPEENKQQKVKACKGRKRQHEKVVP